ncbi:MAG TPA: hypothetical protein VIF62_16025, partial [Labilithrix sp.]
SNESIRTEILANAARSLARAHDARGLFAQLGAAALMFALPLWPLAGLEGPVALALAVLAASVLEPVVAPAYLMRQDEAFGGLASRPTWTHAALRVSAAIVPAIVLRALASAVGSLPGLALVALARATSNASLRDIAFDVGTIGAGIGLFAGCVGTSFVTRAAVLEDASPMRALVRSVSLAARSLMEVTTIQLLSVLAAVALVFAVRMPPLFFLAVVFRWARDVALTGAMRERGSLAWTGIGAGELVMGSAGEP